MTPGQPDTVQQLPAGTGPNVMQPASGSYGDTADLNRLKGALDVPSGPGGPPTTAPTPPNPGVPTGQGMTPAPKGVPDSLMAPTSMPDTPQSTPLTNPATAPQAATAANRTISILSQLSTSAEVSVETREWAKHNLRVLQAAQ